MRRAAIIGLGAVLLIAVAIVFVSPAVDLDPAAFRSPSGTLALLMCLAIFKGLSDLLRPAQFSIHRSHIEFCPAHVPTLHVFELNCARLC